MAPPSDRYARWRDRAPGWTRTAPQGVSTADRNNQRMIAATGIGPGMRVADLATGAGEPAISIALAVGAGGAVAATDLVPEMMEAARRRAAALALAQLRFVVADMAALPYADATFDALTCRFGLMFAPDPVRTVAEARRVLRPGARAAWLAWGPSACNTMFEVTRTAIAGFFGGAPEDGAAGRFRFAGAGDLGAVLRAAGFRDVAETGFDDVDTVPAGAPFVRRQLERNREPRVLALDADGRAALEAAIERAFVPHREGDAYRLRSAVRLAVGTAA